MPETAPIPHVDDLALHWTQALLGLALLLWLIFALRATWRHGLLTREAFIAAPPRPGAMGLHDLAITAGLFILGPTFLATAIDVGRPGAPGAPGAPGVSDAQLILRHMLLSQAGVLPAIAYIFWRADTAVAGGIAGLGLRIRELPISLWRAVKSFVVILPLTFGISWIVIGILLLMGNEPPAIAHQVLVELAREGFGGATAWGLIISAVVIAPVLEEIIFRGAVQTSLLQSRLVVSRWTVIACAAAGFTLIHMPVVEPHSLPGLYILALGLGWTYERWGSLWVPIFIHAIFNAVNIVAALNIEALS